jgi:two-component system, chemotaxis family, sensor kinase CheA
MQIGSEYWDLFFDEADSQLQLLSTELGKLQADNANPAIIREIFRVVHTLKGMAATFAFESVTKLCHVMEEHFAYFQNNKLAVPAKIIDLQIRSADALFNILESIAQHESEPPICIDLSEGLVKQLKVALVELTNPSLQVVVEESKETAKTSTDDDESEKEIKLQIKFVSDCQMPGVRAYMVSQILESHSEILNSKPTTEELLEGDTADLHSLEALIKSSQSTSFLEKKIRGVTDVEEVAILDVRIPAFTFPEAVTKNQGLATLPGEVLKQDPDFVRSLLTETNLEKINKQELHIFAIKLSLTDEVLLPEEQFLDLLVSLNEYLGKVIHSIPSLDALREAKQNQPEIPSLHALAETQSSQQHHKIAKARRKLEFILLIQGNQKSILDFLSDACEVNQVEIVEIKLDEQPEQKLGGQGLGQSSLSLSSALKQPSAETSGNKVADVKTSFARVNLSTVESLMNAVGELVINHNRLKLDNADDPSSETNSTIQYLNQVTAKIQQLVMSIRMVPVSQVFNRFPRFIRDVSRELKKEVELKLLGEETEIDRILIDELYEIFVHLVRNAIDHGLETSEERERFGKSKVGTLRMQAYPQGNNVFVCISDDGRGINVAKVRKKAIEKKIITAEEADFMDEEATLNLIFTSGFSTADQVSDLSGRGVGMDVVKEKILSLGGQILLSSKLGEGTTFKLSIPSTISIIQVLLVENNGLFAIPLSEIKEIVGWSSCELHHVGSYDVVTLHKETIPLIYLKKYINQNHLNLNLKEEFTPSEDSLVIIFQSDGKPYGMIVDSLIGQQEIVIKPISNRVNRDGLVNGATVFGDGRIAMILNVDKVVKMYLQDTKKSLFKTDSQEVAE